MVKNLVARAVTAISMLVIARGTLLYLATKCIYPDRWLSAMIGFGESVLVEEGIVWVLSGLFGLTGLFLGPVLLSASQRWAAARSNKRFTDEGDVRKRRQRIADKLDPLHQEYMQLLMRKVNSIDGYISWKQEIEDWYERAQNEIACSMSPAEKGRFISISAPASDLFVQPFNYEHQQDLLFFGARYHKLGIIIDDMNTRLR